MAQYTNQYCFSQQYSHAYNSNYMPSKVVEEIIHPFPNFNLLCYEMDK